MPKVIALIFLALNACAAHASIGTFSMDIWESVLDFIPKHENLKQTSKYMNKVVQKYHNRKATTIVIGRPLESNAQKAPAGIIENLVKSGRIVRSIQIDDRLATSDLIAEIAEHCPTLIHLELSLNNLIAPTLAPLENHPSLEFLEVSFNVLLNAIPTLPALKILKAEGTALDDNAIKLMQKKQPSLKKLRISCGSISRKAVRYLCECPQTPDTTLCYSFLIGHGPFTKGQ
ncbi:MAG: hypothetical protein ACPGXY_04925 [Alphaproteobacteria bacterium]